ncbi:FecR family protein [Pedobacter alpinus]|uniref:FecR family protein n=1 Tax=Pedobacter alpinus TaxID=1590643 RepID=A0ABW5TTR1_9SPHI
MKEEIWESAIKRLTNNETDASALKLNNWLKEDIKHQQEFNSLKALWDLTGKIPADKIERFNGLEYLIHQKESPKNKKFLQWWYGIAAVIIGLLMLSTVFVFQHSKQPSQTTAELIKKKANVGEVLKLILPDSSTIWLNAESEVSFSSEFTLADNRVINLIGEAYFEVKHDESHPFIVKSGELITTVYGTSFNVRAYRNDSEISVAVQSGKVGVNHLSGKQVTQFLLPKDKLVYELNSKLFKRKNIAVEEVNSWIEGALVFDQTPINEVFQTLSRKFGVQINTEKLIAKDCKLTAKFENNSLTKVLETLKLLMNIQSKQIDKTIFLEGGSTCK